MPALPRYGFKDKGDRYAQQWEIFDRKNGHNKVADVYCHHAVTLMTRMLNEYDRSVS